MADTEARRARLRNLMTLGSEVKAYSTLTADAEEVAIVEAAILRPWPRVKTGKERHQPIPQRGLFGD